MMAAPNVTNDTLIPELEGRWGEGWRGGTTTTTAVKAWVRDRLGREGKTRA